MGLKQLTFKMSCLISATCNVLAPANISVLFALKLVCLAVKFTRLSNRLFI